MERFLFCTIRKKGYGVLGSLAPTRDQWEGPATNCIYFGTRSSLLSFEIDTIRCGRAFSPGPHTLFSNCANCTHSLGAQKKGNPKDSLFCCMVWMIRTSCRRPCRHQSRPCRRQSRPCRHQSRPCRRRIRHGHEAADVSYGHP